jgi:Zn finger protein HypA/HybF involved in hydrogenase expression
MRNNKKSRLNSFVRPYYDDLKGTIWVKEDYLNNKLVNYEFSDDEKCPLDWKNSNDIKFESIESHGCKREPKYLFEYDDSVIQCRRCKSNFCFSEMEIRTDWNEENSKAHNEYFCPICGLERFDVRFEKLNEEELTNVLL